MQGNEPIEPMCCPECQEVRCDYDCPNPFGKTQEQPPESETRTWHEHDDGSWDWGPLCTVCMVDMPQAGDMPYFNIKRLKSENASGFGTDSFKREIYAEAKREGRDITRAPIE